MGDQEVVNLNVGGKTFATYKSTLMTYPDTLLARMFSSSAKLAKKGKDGEYFFDRNPEIFALILEFYRTKRLIVPKGIPLENVKEELNYFGIDLDEDDIEFENERQDNDLVSSFLTFNQIMADLGEKGRHIGNIASVVNVNYVSGEDEEEDEEEEEEDGKKKNKSAEYLEYWKEGGGVRGGLTIAGVPEEDFLHNNKVLKHTKSDSEGENSSDEKPKKKPAKKAATFGIDSEEEEEEEEEGEKIPKDYSFEEFQVIGEHLDKLRDGSPFCAGGWFDINNENCHLRIDTGVPKNPNVVVTWYWAGDSKSGKQNTWIPYVAAVSAAIEAAYGAKEKTYKLDAERYIDFKKMEQIRYDDKSKRRTVQREEGDSKSGPITKKAKVGKSKNQKAEKGKKNVWKDCGPITKLDVAAISEHCVVAPFGDIATMKTVIDPKVRVALECPSTNIRFFQSLSSILRPLQTFLQSNLWKNQSVSFTPYKLNVYNKGGFFKAHTDTPVDPEAMTGTLLLSFPTPHKGGALRVKHGNTEHTFDFASTSSTNKVQWAAFYSDCEHEVLPVEEGNRITFAFTINTGEVKKPKKGTWDPLQTDEEFSDYDEDAHNNGLDLFKYYFLEAGPSEDTKLSYNIIHEKIKTLPIKTVGLFFAHKYTVRGLKPEILKGEDKELYDYLQAKDDLQLSLVPVIVRVQYTRDVEDGRRMHPDEIRNCVYALTKQDLAFMSGRGPKPPTTFRKVPFIVATTRGQLLAKDHVDSNDGSMGNYAPEEDDSLYMSATLIITKK